MEQTIRKENHRISMIIKSREFGITIGLIILVIFFSIANPRFASFNNLLNILRQVSVVGIMACGMTFVVVSGDIDLSVGAVYGMAAMMTGALMLSGLNIVLAILIGLLLGTLFGFLNGLIVTVFKVPAMIATLGTQYICRGFALIVTDGGVVNLMGPRAERINSGIPNFLQIGSGKLFRVIPNMAIIFIIMSLILFVIFHKTILGFKMRAVGGNSNAAMVSGISVKKIKIIAFAIMGFLAAFAGILNFSFLHSVQGTMGQGLEMDVIAGSIIGGASLTGGEGTILGTIIGVLIMNILRTGLVYMGASAYLQMVFIGLVIILAVTIDMMSKGKTR
jgi:ribose/xylose/arabinose/galactoside ABC-type transport system permease subunit